MSLTKLTKRLEEISSIREIVNIDLYGGEITILPKEYIEDLLKVIRQFYLGQIQLSTNLTKLPEILIQKNIYITVSWDYKERERYNSTLEKMRHLMFPFSIQMLVSSGMKDWTSKDLSFVQTTLNEIPNLQSFELKPYSSNQANHFKNTNKVFSRFVFYFLEQKKNYTFINEVNIQNSLNKLNNSFSDDHIYITPNGEYAVLDFDKSGNEYFKEIDSFMSYIIWCQEEKEDFISNKYCQDCNYFGSCLSEHLRPDEGIDGTCSGFKEILDGYAY